MSRFSASIEDYARTRNLRMEWIAVDDLRSISSAHPDWAIPGPDIHITILTGIYGQGQFRAMLRGVAQCKGNLLITMDADMFDNVADIDRFLAHWKRGANLVLGNRTRRNGTPYARRATSAVFNHLNRLIAGVPIRDNNTPMRLLSRMAMEYSLSVDLPPAECALHLYARYLDTFVEVDIETTESETRRSTYRLKDLLGLFSAHMRAAWKFRMAGLGERRT